VPQSLWCVIGDSRVLEVGIDPDCLVLLVLGGWVARPMDPSRFTASYVHCTVGLQHGVRR
jgi:hypothetical protein